MDKFTFPNGYDVDIARKKDVLDAIENNIIDKDIALAIITNCEQNCARFIQEGKWAGIPFMGNFRPRETKIALNSKENKELLDTAKTNMSNEEYLLFRKDLIRDNAIIVKNTRLLHYQASKVSIKNKKLYNAIAAAKGSAYATIIMYSFKDPYLVSESKLYIDNE